MSYQQNVLLKLAEVNEAMLALCHEFRSKPGIETVHHGFNLRKCGTGCLVDAYVEVEVTDDLAYCWWLEIRIAENDWSIEVSVLETKAGEQHPLERILKTAGKELEALITELGVAAAVLLSNAQRFEFTGH